MKPRQHRIVFRFCTCPGFCTQGVVKFVKPENVTLLDQSPQQLAKARAKKDLQGVTIVEVID